MSALPRIEPRERDSSDVAAALARALGAGVRPSALRRLAGHTNRTFRATLAGGDVIVRLAEPTPFVDRAAEARNVALADRLGVGPHVVFADPVDGTLVTRAAPGRPLEPADLARPGVAERVVLRLRRLHESGAPFAGRFDAAAAIRSYAAALAGRPEAATRDALAVVAPALALCRSPATLAPCHNDPTPANVLADGDAVTLIDWEYAGLNDPLWDLAYLGVEAGLDLARLARAYGLDGAEAARLPAVAAVVLAVNGLWAHATGERSLAAFAAARIARFAALAATLREDG
jgi:thiamine kinase-like enzyme